MGVVELIMPRMGESINEATIIHWLKKEGESVEEDETILEIATDKVDSEIPSPVSGVLSKILFEKDQVVPVGTVLAHIETHHAGPVEDSTQFVAQESGLPQNDKSSENLVEFENDSDGQGAEATSVQVPQISSTITTSRIPANIEGRFFSPLVRNIARMERISVEELNRISGSGANGRVTKLDLINYIENKKITSSAGVTISDDPPLRPKRKEESHVDESKSEPVHLGPRKTDGQVEIVEMDRMRQVIASHMLKSLQTSAHVTSFVEADATHLLHWRNQIKGDFLKKYGEPITLTPLFAEAVIKALGEFPKLNSSIDGDRIIIKKNINLGVATAMKNGNLIVPVIKNAENLSLVGLAKNLNDITGRARNNQLKPSEIQGGTFTISNIGTFGNVMGTPIINQPEVAVLALGEIKKKPIIQETDHGDIIAIRHMMFLSLSFDHRIIDGYLGGTFLKRIAHHIEDFNPSWTI